MEAETLQQILGELIRISGRLDNLEQGHERLEQRVTKTDIMIENTVIPGIDLLAEGHMVIQKQIRDLSIIDRMQDDISTLKAAVKYLSGEIENLKSAI